MSKYRSPYPELRPKPWYKEQKNKEGLVYLLLFIMICFCVYMMVRSYVGMTEFSTAEAAIKSNDIYYIALPITSTTRTRVLGRATDTAVEAVPLWNECFYAANKVGKCEPASVHELPDGHFWVAPNTNLTCHSVRFIRSPGSDKTLVEWAIIAAEGMYGCRDECDPSTEDQCLTVRPR